MLEIPEISLPELNERKFEKLSMSLSLTGAFILTSSGIKQKEFERANVAAREFFSKPSAEKMLLHKPGRGRGYLPLKSEGLGSAAGEYSEPDFKESINLKKADFDDEILCSIVPRDLLMIGIKFRKIAEQLIRIIEQAAFPDSSITTLANNPDSIFRTAFYPICSDRIQRVGAHHDYGIITLLKPFELSPCLEIRDPKTKSWETVFIREDGILVNSGLILQRWTNHRWQSCYHRVVSKAENNQERLSFVYFANPNPNITVQPFVGEGEKPKYAPTKAKDLLRENSINSRNAKNLGQ